MIAGTRKEGVIVPLDDVARTLCDEIEEMLTLSKTILRIFLKPFWLSERIDDSVLTIYWCREIRVDSFCGGRAPSK